jgi:hypothetical protein
MQKKLLLKGVAESKGGVSYKFWFDLTCIGEYQMK